MSGTYLVQDYLTTDASPANQAWLAAIARSFGDGAVPSAVGAETYDAVKLVSAAIVKAGSLQGAAIAAATVAVSITGPRGSIEIKPTSRGHATLAMHVGRLQPNNAIEQLAVSGALDPTLAC
jgi:branched-chain amino acid transport system substrate-binding protein